MSAVIEFPAKRIGKVEGSEPAGPAVVIIFPGVRIERSGFSLADRLTPAATRGSRRALAKEIESL